MKGDFESATSDVDIMYKEGYNILDIVNTITKLFQISDMNDELRLAYLRVSTEFKMRILDGLDSHLQLHGFLAKLCTVG